VLKFTASFIRRRKAEIHIGAKQRNVATDAVMPQPRGILNLARSGAKTALNLAAQSG